MAGNLTLHNPLPSRVPSRWSSRYPKICTSITPSASRRTQKGSAVVVIGVRRHGVGRDNGTCRRLPHTSREQRCVMLPDRAQRELPGQCNAALGAPRLNSRPACAPGNRLSGRSRRAAHPAARSGAMNSRPDGRPDGRTGRSRTSSLRLSGQTSARSRSGP